MVYVIAFTALLLLILIVKKQKDKTKQSPFKSTQHRPNKSTERLSFIDQKNKTPVVSASTRARKSSTKTLEVEPLNNAPILALNHDFELEAQLNLALKKDLTQYPLYLELLNLHLKQHNDLAVQLLLQQIEKIPHPDLYQQALEQQRIAHLQRQPESEPTASTLSVETPQNKQNSMLPTPAIDEELEIVFADLPQSNISHPPQNDLNRFNDTYMQGLDADLKAVIKPQPPLASDPAELALIEYYIDQVHPIKLQEEVKPNDQASPANIDLSNDVPQIKPRPHSLSTSRNAIQDAEADLTQTMQSKTRPNSNRIETPTLPITLTDQHALLEFEFSTFEPIPTPKVDVKTEPDTGFKIEFDPLDSEQLHQSVKNNVKK